MRKEFLVGIVIPLIFGSAQFSSIQAQPPPGYTLVFDDEFDGPLDVAPGSGWGDGNTRYKWYCHTPYCGDFGDAYFSGPEDGNGPNGQPMSPFSVNNGVLSITAWIDPTINHWRSGLLSSMDWSGNQGFAQALGYFEVRMKLPDGVGLWPSFWLDGVAQLQNRNVQNPEIDVLEEYGNGPTWAYQTIHVWNPDGSTAYWAMGWGQVSGMTTDYHTYAVLVNPDYLHFYIDDAEVWTTPTPPQMTQPLYVMVDLALGHGQPEDSTPNPSQLLVDYIRVYAPPGQ
ncbi:MAG: glycoside hydrolase family 16 protein [Verrucomicrobia bacterium]|nr:glycoside hydrolase family 16 protein [Verrucomicrobiota bacterium]